MFALKLETNISGGHYLLLDRTLRVRQCAAVAEWLQFIWRQRVDTNWTPHNAARGQFRTSKASFCVLRGWFTIAGHNASSSLKEEHSGGRALPYFLSIEMQVADEAMRRALISVFFGVLRWWKAKIINGNAPRNILQRDTWPGRRSNQAFPLACYWVLGSAQITHEACGVNTLIASHRFGHNLMYSRGGSHVCMATKTN